MPFSRERERESVGCHTHRPGKVRKFDIGHGKVREIVICRQCATAVAIVTK